MEAFEIESQTDQTPFPSRRRCPTQGELAEAQHLFECSTHAFQYTITDGGHLLLSDKLLVAQIAT